MNGYLVFVVALLVLDYVLGVGVDLANLRHIRTSVPEEFAGWYDAEKYARSQRYLRDSTRVDILEASILTPVWLAFILLGGFQLLDTAARALSGGLMITGLAFAGMLLLASYLVNLPFSVYSTFVVEERYDFNRTTWRTFLFDQIKSMLLTAVLGGAVFAGVLWFFANAGQWAWLYSWFGVTAFQAILIYLAPVVILPLFNKFTPLENDELRRALSAYAEKQGFTLSGIFTTDGSRRSTKANAYFTGFGRWRRIVLFDTLLEKHTVEELVAILAHEVGHYKLRHIHKQLLTSFLSTGVMFYLLSLFITRPGLYAAFQVPFEPVGGQPPIYAGLVFFGFLYTPISLVLSLLQRALSRRHEYQADAFAAETSARPQALVHALKKLTVDNLSNLTPHPLKVFLEYSHPPVLARVDALKRQFPGQPESAAAASGGPVPGEREQERGEVMEVLQ